MPRYDYRCPSGHVTEQIRGFKVKLTKCLECGRRARRQAVYAEQYLGGDGITAHCPPREAPINLTRFTEAHGELLRDAEKAGVEPPDLFGAAKERVKRGDAVAIE